MRDGFTLIEFLITFAIAAAVFGFTALSLFGARRGQDLQADAELIQAVLRRAQQHSVLQEAETEWGVCFRNEGTNQYYELFKGMACPPVGVSVERRSLKPSNEFAVPPPGSSAVWFERLSGMPFAAAAVEIRRRDNVAERRVIAVQSNGAMIITE